jgi:hypothetical protein
MNETQLSVFMETRAARSLAIQRLRAAQQRRAFPTIRPRCLQIFGHLTTEPKAMSDLLKVYRCPSNDLREDIELLAFALLSYAPGTVQVARDRRRKVGTRGGSTEYHYALIPAP